MKGSFILVAALAGCLCIFTLTVKHYSKFTTVPRLYTSRKTDALNISQRSHLDSTTVQTIRDVDINLQANSYNNTDHTLPHQSRPNICSPEQRLRYLQEKCKLLQPELDSISGIVITDRKRKLLYCQIEKCSCSTWRYLLQKANSDGEDELLSHIHSNTQLRKRSMNTTTIKGSQWFNQYHEYEDYTKFVVIRHPLERILSSYYNSKRSQKSHSKGEYGPTIRLFNKLMRSREQDTLSLSLFIEAITNPAMTTLYNNVHWKPFTEACNFCEVAYDHIIRVETMAISASGSNHNDAAPILRLLGYDGNILSDVRVNNRKADIPDDTTSRVLLEYKDVPKHLMEKLLDRYKYDMELFGYRFNAKTLRTACRIPVDNGASLTCC